MLRNAWRHVKQVRLLPGAPLPLNIISLKDEDMKTLIGKEKYFVHSGSWKNEHEWRIQKVVVTGLKIDREGRYFVEFSFGCTGYEYPVEYLKDTFEDARKFALEQIAEQKERQVKQIKELVAP